MLVKAQLDVEKANNVIRDGQMEANLGAGMQALKPEAAYFYAENGRRTALIVFDMQDPSDIPSVVEPFSMAANASVDLWPVMVAEELQAGLARFLESSQPGGRA
jgi:hypothetical protein